MCFVSLLECNVSLSGSLETFASLLLPSSSPLFWPLDAKPKHELPHRPCVMARVGTKATEDLTATLFYTQPCAV
jgi:hypothetical protein